MCVNKIVGLIILSLMIFGCFKKDQETPMIQKISDDSLKLSDEAIKNLTVEKVTKGEFPERLSLMGKISVPEDRTVVVPARVSGRTDQIYVVSGEVVRAGQSLCSIFSPDFAIAREEYLQTLKEAKADPNDEETKRLLSLSQKKLNALGVSESDYSKWESSDSNLNTKGENLLVRAPRSGALLTKNAVIGNLVNVGDTLFIIGDMNKVWFAGDIYPEDLPKVRKNQLVEIDPGNGTPALQGKVSFISPAMDPNTRTIKIRALMENPGEQLRADMYVQGNIILSTRTALIAPKNALVRLRDTVFTFKRLPGNIFKKVFVAVDGESTSGISVAKGLDEGDDVVSVGSLLLDASLAGAEK